MGWYADEKNGRFCYADPRTKVWPRAGVRSKRTYDRYTAILRQIGAIIAYRSKGRDNVYWVNSPSGYFAAHPGDRGRYIAPATRMLMERGREITYTRDDDTTTYWEDDDANADASQNMIP